MRIKAIEGYEALYAISDEGQIFNLRTGHEKHKVVMQSGYEYIHLNKGDKNGRMFRVHRLVAKAFIPNPDRLPQVNHINGNKQDNRASNLEWCTPLQNQRHAIESGLFNTVGEETQAQNSRKNKSGKYAKSMSTAIQCMVLKLLAKNMGLLMCASGMRFSEKRGKRWSEYCQYCGAYNDTVLKGETA